MTLTTKLGLIFFVLLVFAFGNTALIYHFQTDQKADSAVVDAAGRNRMLSQRIGFYAEQIVNGNDQAKKTLQEIIKLHDDSFNALRDGGIAPGIADNTPLPPPTPGIIPLIDRAGELWKTYKQNAERLAYEEMTLSHDYLDLELQNSLYFIEDNAPEMLARNDAVTKAFVTNNQKKQLSLNYILAGILSVYLFVITIGFLISRSLVRELQAVEKAKTEFVALATHLLKTPVSSISWDCEMLLNGEFGKVTDDQNRAIGKIAETNGRLKGMINNFINVSSIDLGLLKIDPKPANIGMIIGQIIDTYHEEITRKKINISKKFAEPVPLMSADTAILRMILDNLISNAVIYSEPSSHIEIGLEFAMNEFVFRITNPARLTKNDEKRLFTKLYRGSKSQILNPEGTGLGLYTVKSLTTISGGKCLLTYGNQRLTIEISFPKQGMKHKDGVSLIS